ncbi:MAG: SIMPL domain-containing protein [Pseudopedobacter saltans]|uniref:SIMPL domain-containing protein n=1 Tax=Pseudopedobacter saltans TaxID=151895 RepID=A0A2W5F957_9SPHI|nr:MAG: SIMPL domain-containing protein [Pseudopedobacter saltans]
MKKEIFLPVSALFLSFNAFSQSKNFVDLPYIEVNGSADSLVTPNLIYIKIIVSEKDNRNKLSVEEQEIKMAEAFKAVGIDIEKDLTISDMLSNYKSYFLKQKEIVKTKEYILKVTDAETASKVFIQLEDLGISNTSIQSVDHSDIENIKNACRAKAVVMARKAAEAMTKPLSQKILDAIHIVDNETMLNNQLQGTVAGLMIRGLSSVSNKEKSDQPKISFEKIKVSASVNVAFRLN